MTTTLLRTVAAAVAAMSMSLLTFTSCAPYPAHGTGVGALAEGGTGAGTSGDAGNAHADSEQHDKKQASGTDQPAAPAADGKYPKGYKSDNPFHIISPYKPHNLIDISKNPKTGQPFLSGDLVRDPSNGQIFRIP
jgi:hypothetical protein